MDCYLRLIFFFLKYAHYFSLDAIITKAEFMGLSVIQKNDSLKEIHSLFN
jgi:hypothetical protein